MNTCPKCKLWDLAKGDIFCSWCGHRLISIQMEMARRRFSLAELPPPLDLVLSNQSDSASITVQAVESSDPWVRIEGGKRKPPFTLAPHENEILTVRIRTGDLAEGYHSGSILARTTVGEERLLIDVTPPPKLSIAAWSGSEQRKTCRFDILLDHRNLERNLLRIAAEQGVIVVERIVTDQPEWIAVRPQGGPLPLPIDARTSAYVDVFLDVNEAVLEQKGLKLPAEVTASMTIECGEFTHVEPLVFECRQPPALWIWQEADYAIDAWAGQPGEITLTLQNSLPGKPATGGGNAPLQVSQIDIQEPEGQPCTWLKPLHDPAAVLVVPGGEHRALRFGFETQAAVPISTAPAGTDAGSAEGGIGLGRHPVVFVLTTNLPEVARKVGFEVNVRPIRDFDGVLAIDFGTSNTCCAIFAREHQRYSLVPVDRLIHNPHPTTAPTLIQYLDQPPGGEASIRIGAEIDAQGLSVKAMRSTARSPKRRLGAGGEPFEICFYNAPERVARFSAKQVVADYLREVRRAAERHQRGVRFHSIVVTHPSRFRLDQIMDLEEAVRAAFGADSEIELLPEPVAAALGFIVDKEALAKERYTVGVFDFGGGTTDLSFLEVVNQRANGFIEVRPRQINSTGRWFGGEDLTRFVYGKGLERCRQIAAAEHPQEALLMEAERAADGNQRQIAIENHGRLLQWAEQSKLLLVEHGDDHEFYFPAKPDLFPDLKLWLWAGSGPAERAFPHNQIVPKRGEADAFLRPRLEELADDLAKLVSISGVGSLDYIRLSGKPSAMPLVRQVLAERFAKSQIRPAAEPKECVVEGACIPDRFRAAVGVALILEDSNFVQTTSRIGIEDAGTRRFVEMIGLGVPVSENGLTGHYDNFPFRQGARVRLVENASLQDTAAQGNDPAVQNNDTAQNGEFTVIGTFKVDPNYPAYDTLPRKQPVAARLELRLSRDFTPTLTAHVPNASPIPFVMEGMRTAPGGN